MAKHFLLPEDLRNDLIAYLGSRPYNEVAQGMAKLLALVEAPPPTVEKPALSVVPEEGK